jgi:hypothetical protein
MCWITEIKEKCCNVLRFSVLGRTFTWVCFGRQIDKCIYESVCLNRDVSNYGLFCGIWEPSQFFGRFITYGFWYNLAQQIYNTLDYVMNLCSDYSEAWITGESGFNSQWRRIFIYLPLSPNRVCGHPPFCQMSSGFSSGGDNSGRGVQLITHLHIVRQVKKVQL